MGVIANKLQQDSGAQPATTTPTGGVVSRALAQQSKPKEPNILQGLAQDVARPFERIGGAVMSAIDLDNSKLQGKQITSRPGAFGGQVEQLGYKDGRKLQGTELAKDVAGTALEAGSYAVPVGTTLKGASLLSKVGKSAVAGGVTGAMYGTGQGLQEQKTVGESLGRGVVTGGVGSLVGGSLPVIGKAIPKPKTPDFVKESVLEKYMTSVKPSIAGKSDLGKVNQYKKNVLEAVRTIGENEPNLSFVSDDGEKIVGRAPKSLKELTEAVEQTKKSIFSQYDNLAKSAGGKGLSIELSPIAKELDGVINNQALGITNPKAVEYAKSLRDRLVGANKISATTAQDVIQNYNKALESFYKNPTYDNATQVAIDAMIANNMRKALDDGIEAVTGQAYQQLKNKYGSLKSVEKDVIKAFLRDQRKSTVGLIDFTDIFSGGQVVNGILALNPATVGQGLAAKAIASIYKKMNDPNRAIEKIFKLAKNIPEERLALPAGSKLEKGVFNNVDIQRSVIPMPSSRSERSVGFPQISNQTQSANKAASSAAKMGETTQSIKNIPNIGSSSIPGTIPPKGKGASGQFIEEAKKYKSAEEFKQSITPKLLRDFLNTTEEVGKTANARATGATKRSAGDYLYSQDRDAFNALLDDIKTGRNPNDSRIKQLTDIWNKANKKGLPKNPALFGLPFLGQKQQEVEEQKPFLEPKVVEGVYSIPSRKVTVAEPDLEELGAILFGEVGNRPLDKKLLEARTIANIALNRAEKEGKSLAEVLRQPNQFQAYKGNQYNLYKSGKAATSTISKEKVDAVNKILDEIRQGTLKNNIGDNLSYAHRKDNTIRVYKDWSEQKKDLNNIK